MSEFYKHVPTLQLLFFMPVFRIHYHSFVSHFFHFSDFWSYSTEVLFAFPYTVPSFHVPYILSTCVEVVIFYLPYQFCLLQHVPYTWMFLDHAPSNNILKYTPNCWSRYLFKSPDWFNYLITTPDSVTESGTSLSHVSSDKIRPWLDKLFRYDPKLVLCFIYALCWFSFSITAPDCIILS